MQRGRLTCIAATVLALAACGTGDDPDSPDARTALTVDKAGDDGGEGTLRWAILKSNADPGKYDIVLAAPAAGGLVIKPASQLPSIVGPVRIQGPWTGSGTPTVAVDGSALLDLTLPAACPGQAAGSFGPNARSLHNAGLQVVDSRDVEITGFEVRNFCTGIMTLRSHGNRIHRMRLVANRGAAGVLITGDDGTAAGGSAGNSTGNVIEHNVFLNNSDAVDIARGSNGTIVRSNTFTIDATGIPSSGIQVISSNDAVIEDNTITGYATALQLAGNGHVSSRNTLAGNAIAIEMGGSGYKLTGNVVRDNRTGVLQVSGGTDKLNALSRNLIHDNGKEISACGPLNGIDTVPDSGVCQEKEWQRSRINFSLNGFLPPIANDGAAQCADGFPDCKLPQNHPVLANSAFQDPAFVVRGSLNSRPNQKFSIEFFASPSDGIDGLGEGKVYLGQLEVGTDASGDAGFSFPTGTGNPLKDGSRRVHFTATATRLSNGATSEFSRPQLVVRP